MLSLKKLQIESRPRLREKDSSALGAEICAHAFASAFACAFSRERARLRLQSPSTMTSFRGRAHPRPAIQGRRVGEWHGHRRLGTCRAPQRREACVCVEPVRAGRRRTIRDRLTGRTPRSERGDRGSIPCPGIKDPQRIQVAEWQTRGVESAVGNAHEGSTPSLGMRASSSIAESACLTNRKLLVRVQPRLCPARAHDCRVAIVSRATDQRRSRDRSSCTRPGGAPSTRTIAYER